MLNLVQQLGKFVDMMSVTPLIIYLATKLLLFRRIYLNKTSDTYVYLTLLSLPTEPFILFHSLKA
jgi:hypothetical protein